ncbi:MAG: ATP-binding cassette domain-containing protein [Gaiellaceae bacterium]
MIAVENLRKRYGKAQAVDGLSFTVEPGRVVGFLGPNGAGKTTTLRILLGLVRANSGQATILGKRYAELERPFCQVGAVLEASGFHPGRKARNHLRVLARAGRAPMERVDEVLELVGLEGLAGKRVGGYSLGMRQRLALAAALLGHPGVLILDEPANGLDPEGIRWLRDLLRSLAGEGRAVLISSHVLAEVEQTVDEVVIINKGKFVAHGSIEELTRGAERRVRVSSPQARALKKRLAEAGIEADEDGDALFVAGATSARVGEIAAKYSLVLHELTPLATQLEDVFFDLTAGETK